MIEVRDATEGDLAALLTIYNDAVVNTTAVYDYEPRGMEAELKWFAAKRDQNLPVLAAVQDGGVAGFASYGPFRPWPAYLHSVENSVYVAPDRRGMGIGAALMGPLIERAREGGYRTMLAGIDAGNAASKRLHARFGFVEVGVFREVGWKFERWLDLVFMQMML
jgi:phosphinothricin acetyltransferase